MLYKNSIKILFSNFHIVWKSILYFLIVFLVSIGLLYLCINPIFLTLKESGIISEAVGIYTEFMTSLNLSEMGVAINELFESLFEVLINNISNLWISFAGIFLIIFVFSVILNNLSIMANCNSLHYYMGSMNKSGFYSSFYDTVGKSIKVQLAYFIVSLPIKIINLTLIILTFRLFKVSILWSILAVFITIVLYIILVAFKVTIFSGWIPTMVIMNYGVLKSLRVSIRNAFRKFPRIFGNAVGMVLTLFCAYGLVFFTFFVGLIIVIPATYLFYSCFGMVLTYESQGMRYYVDIYNVITPKKKEISDKLTDMKYIV